MQFPKSWRIVDRRRAYRIRLQAFVARAGLALALGCLLSACAGSSGSGFTLAPSSSPVGAASSVPAGAGPTATNAAAVPSTSPSQATGGSTAAVLHETARNIAFEQTTLNAPANVPFEIAFDNEDAGIPHDIAIDNPSGSQVFQGTIVTGVTKTTYDVQALPPGTYTFHCVVHPTTMVGTLTVR